MIYFITDGEYVKIGFTSGSDVDNRLNALQIGNARKLTLLATIEGGRESELALHSVFEGLRVRGEWFKLTLPDEMIEDIVEGREYLCEDCRQSFGTVQALNAHGRWCKAKPELVVHSNGAVKQ